MAYKIDYWFLDQLEEILNIESSLQDTKLSDLDHEAIYSLKRTYRFKNR